MKLPKYRTEDEQKNVAEDAKAIARLLNAYPSTRGGQYALFSAIDGKYSSDHNSLWRIDPTDQNKLIALLSWDGKALMVTGEVYQKKAWVEKHFGRHVRETVWAGRSCWKRQED